MYSNSNIDDSTNQRQRIAKILSQYHRDRQQRQQDQKQLQNLTETGGGRGDAFRNESEMTLNALGVTSDGVGKAVEGQREDRDSDKRKEEEEEIMDDEEDTLHALDRLLSTPDALDHLPQIRSSIDDDIRNLKVEIEGIKRGRPVGGEQLQEGEHDANWDLSIPTTTHISHVQSRIERLLSQITSIRERSREAETVVRSITEDIQRLDVAKSNLTRTMITVERWQMVVEATSQLKVLIEKKDYVALSHTLAAIDGLTVPLLQVVTKQIPMVSNVLKEIQTAKTVVKEMTANEFDRFFSSSSSATTLSNAADTSTTHNPASTIQSACLVVDVLGNDFRSHIIERYLSTQLKEYKRIFSSSGEAGQIDNTARRYAWFRRCLNTHEQGHDHLFPQSWQIARALTTRFAEMTKNDLVMILSGFDDGSGSTRTGAGAGAGQSGGRNTQKESLNVGVYLEAWQATIEWQQQMGRRFGMPFNDISKGLPIHSSLSTPISQAFEPYFRIFVDAQDKAFEDMLSAYRGARSRPSLEVASASEDPSSAEAPLKVLPSSTELFYLYGQALSQCQKYTTGQGMKELADVFAKWLKVYSEEVLIASMKRPDNRKSLDGKPNIQELRTACLILNTADYCLVTGTQLEEKLKEIIDPSLADQVSFQSERELFMGVATACILVMLQELEAACEPAFSAILKTPWNNIENVSGRSAYIVDLVGSIKTVAEVVRERIDSQKYVRNFADKAVGVILKRFTGAVVKSRPLRVVGAEQILLDVQAIKSCLLELPGPYSVDNNNTFTRLVTKTISQLETMLKVVLAQEDPPEAFVQNYCLLIGDKSFSNFQKILDLKGTQRNNQQKLLDIFLSVTSTQEDLTDTSFLTHLDMDPDNKGGTVIGQAAAAAAASERHTSNHLPSLFRSVHHSQYGSGQATPQRTETPNPFGDFRRMVSFAIRGEQ